MATPSSSNQAQPTTSKADDDFDSELAGLRIPELDLRKPVPTSLASQFPEAAAAAATESYDAPEPPNAKTTEKQRVEASLLGKTSEETKVGAKRAALREKAARFKRTESGAPSKAGGPLAALGIENLQESLQELSEAALAESRGEELSAQNASDLMTKTQKMLNSLLGGMSAGQKRALKKSSPGAGQMISQLMSANPAAAVRRPRARRPAAVPMSSAADEPVPDLISIAPLTSAPTPSISEPIAPPSSSPSPSIPISKTTTADATTMSKSKKRREKLKQKAAVSSKAAITSSINAVSSPSPSHPSLPD
jgi:hypothetical protein